MTFEEKINVWEIVPNVGVGEFHILDTLETIIKYVHSHDIKYTLKEEKGNLFIIMENIMVAFDKNNCVFAISVFHDFKGKIFNCIGLGSTLSDVERFLGKYTDGLNDCYPTYELEDIKGVEFKLSDDDKYDDIDDLSYWNEKNVPIVKITVWNDTTWAKQVGRME